MTSHVPADKPVLIESAKAPGRRSLALTFPSSLEAEFQADYADRYRKHMAIGLGIGLLAILVSAFEDIVLPSSEQAMPLFIRFGLMFPLNLLLFFIVYEDWRRQWQQPLLMMATLGGALGFLLMGFFTSGIHSRLYVETLVLIQIFGLVLLRMQFPYAVACIMVIGPGAAVALFNFPFSGGAADHFVSLSLIVFAGSLCLIGNYLMESAARSDFLQRRLLESRQRDLEASNTHLQRLLRSDALTGIANRRYFDQRLTEEFRRAERGAYPLALLMIDIDYFKPYNDTYGHQAGDEALAAVAAVLSSFARRPGDLAARYGGEEFALILPGSDEGDAREIADELVLAVHARGLAHGRSLVSTNVTVSAGVASVRPGQQVVDEAELIARADRALYLAKHQGRHRAFSWSEASSF
ncbi:MAG: diguanylate cyclase [Moraxellaceae bacterium]|nr:diguanylate cyclase [Moraxellaceae bacterium]